MKKNTLKKILISIAALVLVMGTFVACGKTDEGAKEPTLSLVPEEELNESTSFKLGDVFADMSVTTPEGTTYKISEILKEKKAVVLNFWYINCGPCKMEFPYMQDAYEKHQENIEILAVNPYDGTDETVAEFKKKFELTFPVAVVDGDWEKYLKIEGYPTTVVIDRYGVVSFMHTGYYDNVEVFDKLFGFFTAEDYEQTVVERLSDIQ